MCTQTYYAVFAVIYYGNCARIENSTQTYTIMHVICIYASTHGASTKVVSCHNNNKFFVCVIIVIIIII